MSQVFFLFCFSSRQSHSQATLLLEQRIESREPRAVVFKLKPCDKRSADVPCVLRTSGLNSSLFSVFRVVSCDYFFFFCFVLLLFYIFFYRLGVLFLMVRACLVNSVNLTENREQRTESGCFIESR